MKIKISVRGLWCSGQSLEIEDRWFEPSSDIGPCAPSLENDI